MVSGRLRYAGRLGAAGLLFLSILANLLRYFVLLRDHYDGSDFRLYYAAARTGLEQGWSHIYDPSVLRLTSIVAGGPPKPFLNPPPMAWLAAPFALVPYQAAYVLWSLLCALALAASILLLVRGARARLLGAALALALFPTLFALYLGQSSVFVLLAVAACWRLQRAGHDLWAGLALALIIVKPQMALVLPPALLVAGRFRVFAAWAAATVAAVAVCALSLGPDGITEYLRLTSNPLPEDSVYTLAGLLGRGPLTLALQAVCGLAALAAAFRTRRRLELVFAAGLFGSALAAPYWHVQDFLAVIAGVAIVFVTLYEGGAGLAPTAAAWLLSAAVFLAASPLWVGGTFKPAWIEVGFWLLIEAATLAWLLWPEKERAPAAAGALLDERVS
jgi:hypothetical protein